MQLFINDTPVTCAENLSLQEILSSNGFPAINIAVAVNGSVIPKIQWNTFNPEEGSRIIIIKAVQGG